MKRDGWILGLGTFPLQSSKLWQRLFYAWLKRPPVDMWYTVAVIIGRRVSLTTLPGIIIGLLAIWIVVRLGDLQTY